MLNISYSPNSSPDLVNPNGQSLPKIRFDSSSITLIGANIITLVYAYILEWQLSDLLLVYWFQSVIIGFFQMLKILDLKNFTTEGFRSNGQPVPPTEKSKRETALFFAFHYGFFHFGYLVFILKSSPAFAASIPLAVVFFINHLYSYLVNRSADSIKRQNLGAMFFRPYIRIVPMHLTILVGAGLFSGASVIFFQILKTIADVLMHSVEHSKPPADAIIDTNT